MSLSPEECAGILNLKAAAGFKRQATRQRKARHRRPAALTTRRGSVDWGIGGSMNRGSVDQ